LRLGVKNYIKKHSDILHRFVVYCTNYRNDSIYNIIFILSILGRRSRGAKEGVTCTHVVFDPHFFLATITFKFTPPPKKKYIVTHKKSQFAPHTFWSYSQVCTSFSCPLLELASYFPVNFYSLRHTFWSTPKACPSHHPTVRTTPNK